jgi:NADPH:quinone reductase-like Zn-dependent oxidoreductase
MKALIFRETGEPTSVLKLTEIPTPPLARGEALVRVLLSPINPSDLHMVRGRYGYQPELPTSPDAEGVGIVEAVGPGAQGPIVGTRVVFVHAWNTWREQIVCPADKKLMHRNIGTVRTLPDDKQVRRLSGGGKIVSTIPSAFDEQLKICREEWRRRHPK